MTAPLRNTPYDVGIMMRMPAGRRGTPGDLGGTAIWLAPSATVFVTAAIIRVDGGYAIR